MKLLRSFPTLVWCEKCGERFKENENNYSVGETSRFQANREANRGFDRKLRLCPRLRVAD